MAEAKPVKSKTLYSAEKPHVGVKVVRRKPGKTSLAAAYKTKAIKNKLKADKVATSTEKATKPKGTRIVKTTKNTRTGNEAKDKEAEYNLDVTWTAEKTQDLETAEKTQNPETAKKTADTETAKKTADTKTAKKTADTKTAKKTADTKTAKKTADTKTAKKTKDTKIAKKTKDTEADKKTKQDTGKLNTTAGTSRMKVPKKSKAVNNIQKNEVTDKKIKLIDEVYEAITINGEPRKGATSQAIKNYIFSKRGIENEDASHSRMNKRINNALRKAVENGDLSRPTTSKGTAPMVSALGRFVLAKKVTKSKIPKQPKIEEDSESME